MEMVWYELTDGNYAKLECYENAWSALSLFTDLIQKMGEVDSELIQEENFCKLLDECGFKDLTNYKNPYDWGEITEDEMVVISLSKAKAKKLGLLPAII